MRNISDDSLTVLAQRLGNEPISIVEIEWIAGRPVSYADRTVGIIPGKLLEVGDIDNVVDLSNSTNSAQLNLSLDDTDGSLKAIFNSVDIQNRPVRLYQWFEGLPLSDKFLVFSGRILTPISWSEHDRSLKITAVSQIEDLEVGFSAEEGDFPYIPSELVGKAWPMIFGTVLDYPALAVNFAIEGVSLNPVGILTGIENFIDSPLYENGTNKSQTSNASSVMQAGVFLNAAFCWQFIDDAKSTAFLDQANAIYDQIGKAAAQQARAEACTKSQRDLQAKEALELGLGDNPIQVVGGEDFPQNTTVTVTIGGGLFTGHFEGAAFYIESRSDPAAALSLATTLANALQQEALCPPVGTAGSKFDYRAEVPCGSFCGDFNNPCEIREYGYFWGTAPVRVSAESLALAQNITHLWADAGARVVLGSDTPLTYIASITPGTVLSVKAFQTLPGSVRHLAVVPTDYYTVVTQNYGSITAVQVVLKQTLSMKVNEGWDDALYISFQSTVGPDIVEILKYLITNYTTLTWDDVSFNHVQEKLQPFPANFPLLSRENVLTVLKDIAFQARCAIWLQDGVIYLKYLPEEPTGDALVDTITVSDIDAEQGTEVFFSNTEDLVTKMIVQWQLSWSPEPGLSEQQTMILRHNVAKYGLKEKSYTWYIYNQPDVILKMATFWLIRYSNTWKRLKFRTFLNKLNLETYDAVTFNVPGIVATGSVPVMVLKAAYNSADNCVDFECEAPVLAGTMVKYPFYWPSALAITHKWPPADEIENGSAGGGGIGSNARGQLPIGFTGTLGSGGTVYVGGPNVVFGPHADYGDSTPTDVGFVAQKVVQPSAYASVTARPKPQILFKPTYLHDALPLTPPDKPAGLTLDLASTKVMDSRGGDDVQNKYGYLRDVFALSIQDSAGTKVVIDLAGAKVTDTNSPDDGEDYLDRVVVVKQGELMVDGRTDIGAKIVSDDNADGAFFDYQYDPDGKKMGAGTAFLQDET